MPNHHVDLVALCEVTSQLQYVSGNGGLASQNNAVTKAGAKGARSKKKASAQLGYGAMTRSRRRWLNQALSTQTIQNYNAVHGGAPGFKGGSIFDSQSKRAVAKTMPPGHAGIDVYVYHANASNRARHLVPWAASSIAAENPGRPFVMIGDFNANPGTLDAFGGGQAAFSTHGWRGNS